MNITDIRIRKTYSDNRLRALVSITVDYDLAVHDIKIIEGPERLFVAMPSRKDENDTFLGYLPSHHPSGKKAVGRCRIAGLPAIHHPAAGSGRQFYSRLFF